jgi:hypothetical protein
VATGTGIDLGHQLVGLFALEVPAEDPGGAVGDFHYVGAPLVEQTLEGVAQPIPPFLEGQDARVATADFEGDCARGNGPLDLANPHERQAAEELDQWHAPAEPKSTTVNVTVEAYALALLCTPEQLAEMEKKALEATQAPKRRFWLTKVT